MAQQDVRAQLAKTLKESAKAPDFLTYYFLTKSKALTPAEVAKLAAELGLKDVVSSNAVAEKINDSHYHLALFRIGNNLKHNGKILKGPHNEDVTVQVLPLHPGLSSFVATNLADDAAKKLLKALEILDEDSASHIMDQVRLLLEQGKVILDQKNCETHATLQILLKLGVDISIKQLIPMVSTALLKELEVLSDEDQLEKIQSFLIAVISVGVSIKHISESVQILIEDKAYFQSHVKRWFNPVRLSLNSIVMKLGKFIKAVEDYHKSKDPHEMASAMVSLQLLGMQVKDLVEKLPALEQKIIEYAQKTQVLMDQQRSRAIAGLLSAGASLACSLPQILEKGWEALGALEKVDFVIGMVQTGVSLTEAGTAGASFLQMKNHMGQAKQYAEFYESLKEQLDTFQTTINQGLSTGPVGVHLLLDEFKENLTALTALSARANQLHNM